MASWLGYGRVRRQHGAQLMSIGRDPAVIALVLADADTSGDKVAAKRHGVSTRTIERWRAKFMGDKRVTRDVVDVSALVEARKGAIVDGWTDEVRRVRLLGLARMAVLIESSDELRDVTGAVKILNDAVLADRVVSDGLGVGSVGSPGSGQETEEAPRRSLALFTGGKR